MRPFDGLFVLDFTHVLAGPYCTYQLALLGADVIRIEPPGGGDIIRGAGGGMTPAFMAQNANKKSLALDLKTAPGREVAQRLAAECDVLVENFRPGVMDRLGLGHDNVKAANPAVIYCSITGYGQDGPLGQRPAYDHVIQGMSGVMAVNGRDAGRPQRVGFPFIDYAAGLMAAFAVASALVQRGQTGKGQRIDTAMLDTALVLMAPVLAQQLIAGQAPRATGGRAFSGSPFSGVFDTSDGQLVLAANTPKQARALCDALDLADLADDPRAADWQANPDFAAEVQRSLNAVFATRSADAWEQRLSAADVPAGRLRDVADILAHPHIDTREVLHEIADMPGVDQPVTVPGVGFKLADSGQKVTAPPPRLGEHSREVLARFGYSAADIDALAAEGVIACNDGS